MAVCSSSASARAFLASLSAASKGVSVAMPKSYIKLTTRKQAKTLPLNAGNAGWQDAIEKAKVLLAETKARASRLRCSIRIFESTLAAGEPWPGVQESDKKER